MSAAVAERTLERMDPKRLYEKAKRGDLDAGRQLIKLCRWGSVECSWEKSRPVGLVSDEEVKAFIDRRRKAHA